MVHTACVNSFSFFFFVHLWLYYIKRPVSTSQILCLIHFVIETLLFYFSFHFLLSSAPEFLFGSILRSLSLFQTSHFFHVLFVMSWNCPSVFTCSSLILSEQLLQILYGKQNFRFFGVFTRKLLCSFGGVICPNFSCFLKFYVVGFTFEEALLPVFITWLLVRNISYYPW